MCITPDAREADRIRQYCGDHGIDTSLLTFHHQPSERVLPKLDLEPLDLVLIDGSHSFPRSSKIGSSLNTRCVSAVRSSSTMCTFGPAVSCEISCALSALAPLLGHKLRAWPISLPGMRDRFAGTPIQYRRVAYVALASLAVIGLTGGGRAADRLRPRLLELAEVRGHAAPRQSPPVR